MQIILRFLGSGVCHQIPARTLKVGSVFLPVCARDTGVILGCLISLMYLSFRQGKRAGFPQPHVLITTALFFVIMGFDGATSYLGLRATTNDIRLITGLLAGFSVGLLLFLANNASLWTDTTDDKILGAKKDYLLWLSMIPLVFLVIRSWPAQLGALLSLMITFSIVLILGNLNLILLSLNRRFFRRANSIWQILPRGFFAVILALAELSLLGLIRLEAVRSFGV